MGEKKKKTTKGVINFWGTKPGWVKTKGRVSKMGAKPTHKERNMIGRGGGKRGRENFFSGANWHQRGQKKGDG